MKDCLITFRSITPVQRAESVLKQARIHCSLQRTPKWMEEKGCGYSLKVPAGHLQTVIELLKAQNVPYRKIYCVRQNGTTEEMVL